MGIDRRTVIGALGLTATGWLQMRAVLAAGAPQGILRQRGEVRVNGVAVQRGALVKPGDTVATARGAEAACVIGQDAFLIRGDTQVRFEGAAVRAAVSVVRLVTGGLLSVFGRGEHRALHTVTATVGIRGTGAYLAVEPMRTYVCICYGQADLVPVDEPAAAEIVKTQHHDEPRWLYRSGMPRMIERAPLINHTDAELILLESLVGRKVPFTTPYPD